MERHPDRRLLAQHPRGSWQAFCRLAVHPVCIRDGIRDMLQGLDLMTEPILVSVSFWLGSSPFVGSRGGVGLSWRRVLYLPQSWRLARGPRTRPDQPDRTPRARAQTMKVHAPAPVPPYLSRFLLSAVRDVCRRLSPTSGPRPTHPHLRRPSDFVRKIMQL